MESKSPYKRIAELEKALDETDSYCHDQQEDINKLRERVDYLSIRSKVYCLWIIAAGAAVNLAMYFIK